MRVPRQNQNEGPRTSGVSHNKRGGTFYVLDNPQTFKSMSDLLTGEIAPATAE
jgi:hypothetical protein